MKFRRLFMPEIRKSQLNFKTMVFWLIISATLTNPHVESGSQASDNNGKLTEFDVIEIKICHEISRLSDAYLFQTILIDFK